MIRDVPLLAIETSTPVGSVAVGREGHAPVEVRLAPPVRHAESVLPAIAFTLDCAGLAREDVAGVVIGGGPGSFTGLRIAAATAKGLARGLDVPVFAYSGLRALAAEHRRVPVVCGMFDARRGQVYAACYRTGEAMETLMEPDVGDAVEIAQRLASHEPLFVGPGALRNTERLERAGARVASGAAQTPGAAALLWLAWSDPERGRIEELAGWEPNYVRASSAERRVAG